MLQLVARLTIFYDGLGDWIFIGMQINELMYHDISHL